MTHETEPSQTGDNRIVGNDRVYEWLALAWQHEKLAEFALSLDPPPRVTTVYQYRLAAENYLKALLERLGLHIPSDNALPVLVQTAESCIGTSLGITDHCAVLNRYSGPEEGSAQQELDSGDVIRARTALKEVAAVVRQYASCTCE
jgi:HEPN domain-containing protein